MAASIDWSRFFDLGPDLLCVASADGVFRAVNLSFTRELGWSREELTSRPFAELVHPDDRDATRTELEDIASGVPTLVFSNRYRTKDGRYVRLHWTAFVDRASGLIYGHARIGRD